MKRNRRVWAWVIGDGRLLSLRIGGKVGRVEWLRAVRKKRRRGGHSRARGSSGRKNQRGKKEKNMRRRRGREFLSKTLRKIRDFSLESLVS